MTLDRLLQMILDTHTLAGRIHAVQQVYAVIEKVDVRRRKHFAKLERCRFQIHGLRWKTAKAEARADMLQTQLVDRERAARYWEMKLGALEKATAVPIIEANERMAKAEGWARRTEMLNERLRSDVSTMATGRDEARALVRDLVDIAFGCGEHSGELTWCSSCKKTTELREKALTAIEKWDA